MSGGRDASEQAKPRGASGGMPLGVVLTRYGLPAAILLAGAVVGIADPGGHGAVAFIGMTGVCACVVLWNLLLRLGVSGDRERVREAAARDYYDQHGRWPDA